MRSLSINAAITITGHDLTITGISNGLRTDHDALYKWAPDMGAGAGAPVYTPATWPRWVLGKGDSVTVVQEFPTTWTGSAGSADGRGFIARMPYSKEAVGAGNVHLTLGYRIVNLVGGDFLAAKTVFDKGAIAVPGAVGQFVYEDDLSGPAPIPLPGGAFFGDAPQIGFEITRVNDAADTYAGGLGVYGFFCQRADF